MENFLTQNGDLFSADSLKAVLARDFAHLARPQVLAEHRRTVVRRASAMGREHSQGAKLPLKVCEDCSNSIPEGGQGRPILTCRNKAGSPGRLWVVDADDSCNNFTQDNQLLAPHLAEALSEGAKLIPLTQDKFAIVDPEDYEQLREYKWYAKKGGNTYYAARGVRIFKDGEFIGVRQILMHRVITNAPAGLMVDHINHNGLDNRRSNLRLCTRAQNAQNSRSRQGSSSKYKGVFLEKTSNRYLAHIRHNGKRTKIGRFKNEVDAAKAYDKKAREFFGEFAYLNFPEVRGHRTGGGKIFFDILGDGVPGPPAFFVVRLQQRYAEAMFVAAKTRQRHNTYTGRTQQVIYEPLIDRHIVHIVLDELLGSNIGNRQRLFVAKDAVFKKNGHVECALRLYHDGAFDPGKYLVRFIRAGLEHALSSLKMLDIPWVAHDKRDRELGQARRAHLKHLGVYQALNILLKRRVSVLIENFNPPAPGTRPRKLLRYTPKRHAGYIVDNLAQVCRPCAVVHDMSIYLVTHHEDFVASCDIDDLFEKLARINRTGGVVRVNQQYAGYRIVVLNLVLEVVEVRHPVFLRVQLVSEVLITGMSGLCGGVGRIGRRWPDNPRFASQKAEYLGNGVA